MKWKAIPINSCRVKRCIAWFPRRIGDTNVWLGFFWVLERYDHHPFGGADWYFVRESLEPISDSVVNGAQAKGGRR